MESIWNVKSLLTLNHLWFSSGKPTIKHKIHLIGADPYQWALREDYDQTVQSIQNFARLESFTNAKIIHSVYWEALKKIPSAGLNGKTVICNLSGEWSRYESNFGTTFLDEEKKVDIWVVRSRAMEKELKEKKKNSFFIPYTINTAIFRPLPQEKTSRLQEKLRIPKDAYVIGNFMRDSNANPLMTPKLVKGPDIFADIVSALHNKGLLIHVLLAGPRRHWLLKTLKNRGVPYSYAGRHVSFDDMRINTLKRKELNILYNLLDLSLVTSRSEAGPHAILEAAAANCPQLSTRVGIAPDILPQENLYSTVEEGAALIEGDIKQRMLLQSRESIHTRVLEGNTPEAVAPLYKQLYESVQ